MDPVTVVTPALTAIGDGIEGLAGPALLIGAGVVALLVGWGVAKKFVRG
jgi:hypothetical protein